MAPGERGQAQFNLSTYLTPLRRRTGEGRPGGWWFATEVDVLFDPTNVLRPDVVGWRSERVPERPRGVPISLRPDWICEVLSTNRLNDLIKKKRVYHRHEVPHYWVIDPEDETHSVYRWAPEGYIELLAAERSETVSAEPFEAVPLRVGVLFGDDQVRGRTAGAVRLSTAPCEWCVRCLSCGQWHMP